MRYRVFIVADSTVGMGLLSMDYWVRFGERLQLHFGRMKFTSVCVGRLAIPNRLYCPGAHKGMSSAKIKIEYVKMNDDCSDLIRYFAIFDHKLSGNKFVIHEVLFRYSITASKST